MKNQGSRVKNQTALIVNYVRKLTIILMIAVINVRGVKNTLTSKKLVGLEKRKKKTIPKIIIRRTHILHWIKCTRKSL